MNVIVLITETNRAFYTSESIWLVDLDFRGFAGNGFLANQAHRSLKYRLVVPE